MPFSKVSQTKRFIFIVQRPCALKVGYLGKGLYSLSGSFEMHWLIVYMLFIMNDVSLPRFLQVRVSKEVWICVCVGRRRKISSWGKNHLGSLGLEDIVCSLAS